MEYPTPSCEIGFSYNGVFPVQLPLLQCTDAVQEPEGESQPSAVAHSCAGGAVTQTACDLNVE